MADGAQLHAGKLPLPVDLDRQMGSAKLPVGGLASVGRLLGVPADRDGRVAILPHVDVVPDER